MLEAHERDRHKYASEGRVLRSLIDGMTDRRGNRRKRRRKRKRKRKRRKKKKKKEHQDHFVYMGRKVSLAHSDVQTYAR
jgi:hypothetical protein